MTSGRQFDLPPALFAAARTSGDRRRRAHERAYPLPIGVADDVGAALLAATRALLSAEKPEQVVAVVATLVHDLGGGIVPARLKEATSLPLDVSLGVTEPMLAWADPVSVSAMQLASVLPAFMVDAREAFDRLQAVARLAGEAERDSLTGLLTRRGWMRRLGAAGEGDAVCLIDLDNFKAVNDTGGHPAGDAVLAAVGALLIAGFRSEDSCGRYGGDELAVLTADSSADVLAARVDRLRQTWQQCRPEAGASVGLSAGVASVRRRGGGREALEAADRALYRAKSTGRNKTCTATDEEDQGAQT